MKAEPLLLGVDAGTTRVRALIFTASGAKVAEGSTPTPMDVPHPGWVEFDSDRLWEGAVAAIRTAVAQVDDPGRIVGVATSSVGETGIGLDAEGRPTARAIGWYDKRAKAEEIRLREMFDPDRLALRLGMRVDPIAGLLKQMWFRRTDPDAFARTAHWLTVADFLTYRLSGEVVTDYSIACRQLALDLHTLDWAWDLIEAVGVPRHQFQQILPSGTRVGTIRPEVAAATGLPEGCVVGVGGHDHPLGGLAVGAFEPNTLIDSLGTSEACLLAIDRPFEDPAIVAQGFEQGVFVVERPMYFALGGLYTCGAAVEWFRSAFAGGASYDSLNEGAAAVPPGSLGVHFFPHLRLGTPPNQDARSRGAFIGLNTDANPAVLYRALLEGIAYDLRNLKDAVTAIPGAPQDPRIRIIGGGAKNSLLLKIKATVYERTLDVVEVEEAVSLGAALFAGLAAGVYRGLDEALKAVPRTVQQVEPVPEWGALYRHRFENVWRPAVKALQPLHWAAQQEP
jgi:xylulokinase